ncbi:MAG: DUF3617 family protein [Steroidobacteraceae bacterium]
MNLHRIPVAALACVVAVAAPSLAAAQKVPGEKWKQSVGIEMAGMKMPARSFEVCVPVGKAEQALAKPPENENCQVNNAKQSGNKFSADIVCTGKQAMQGHIETTTEGNRNYGKMQMTAEGMTMNMNFDSTKLGTACEATDVNAVVAKAQADGAKAQTQACVDFSNKFKKDPRELGGASSLYVESSGICKSHASFKDYCSTLQTPTGFASVSSLERLAAKSGTKGTGSQPLTTSMTSCGLGSADALRTRLLATAVKDNNWDYQVQEGTDATWANLVAIGKRECAGRSFTNQAKGAYSSLCNQYGVALARNDRAAAQNIAISNPAYRASVGPTSDEPAPAAASSPDKSGAAEAPAAETPESKGKARDALDKGKQKLKNIFGGG